MPVAPQNKQFRQRGFALIAVMALGAVAMYSVTSLIGGGTVVERRAQEEELLKLRAYWAAQGHISYAISRGRQGPPCGNKCNNSNKRARAYDDYLGELHDAGSHRLWRYPEIGGTYDFPVAASASNSSPNVDIAVAYPAAATGHPLISSTWPIRRGHSAIVCAGLPDTDSPCLSVDALDSFSGVAKIARMHPN